MRKRYFQEIQIMEELKMQENSTLSAMWTKIIRVCRRSKQQTEAEYDLSLSISKPVRWTSLNNQEWLLSTASFEDTPGCQEFGTLVFCGSKSQVSGIKRAILQHLSFPPESF